MQLRPTGRRARLALLGSAALSRLAMDELRPDAKQNWLNLTSNDFDELMPLIDKGAKASTKAGRERAIFKPYQRGSLPPKPSRRSWRG